MNKQLFIEHRCNALHALFSPYVAELIPIESQFTKQPVPYPLPNENVSADTSPDDVIDAFENSIYSLTDDQQPSC